MKISSKQQNLDYLRNLLMQSSVTTEEVKVNQANPSPFEISATMNIGLQCKVCTLEIEDSIYNRCAFCSLAICHECAQQCLNKSYDHPRNSYCPDCIISCLLCKNDKLCRTCVRKCFFKGCDNYLCTACYDKNKHQLRPESTNCKFFKCDNCQTDGNCIMTTVYCGGSCDKRVCRNCFQAKHREHIK
jgi:hypothetical protein